VSFDIELPSQHPDHNITDIIMPSKLMKTLLLIAASPGATAYMHAMKPKTADAPAEDYVVRDPKDLMVDAIAHSKTMSDKSLTARIEAGCPESLRIVASDIGEREHTGVAILHHLADTLKHAASAGTLGRIYNEEDYVSSSLEYYRMCVTNAKEGDPWKESCTKDYNDLSNQLIEEDMHPPGGMMGPDSMFMHASLDGWPHDHTPEYTLWMRTIEGLNHYRSSLERGASEGHMDHWDAGAETLREVNLHLLEITKSPDISDLQQHLIKPMVLRIKAMMYGHDEF